MAILTSSKVNMMSNNDWCFCLWKDRPHWLPLPWCILLQLCKRLATLPKTVLTKYLLLANTAGCIPRLATTTIIETGHSPLTADSATEHASTSHDHSTDANMTETLAATEDMHPTSHPTTTVVHTILCLTNAPCDNCDHAPFPTGVSLKVIPQTKANLVQATLTILLKYHTQRNDKTTPKNSNPSQIPLPEDGHHSRFKIRLLPGVRQWIKFLKLLEPPPSNDEDPNKWRRQSMTNHYTIELVSDSPTVTVHARKRFKALIKLRADISLIHISVYNMVKDCYKTSILPATIHLKTADGSPMSSMGKVTPHLFISNFKFCTPSLYVTVYQKLIFYLALISRKYIILLLGLR